jgi:O-antigen chain-terminating bifunctional methyltransferase/kinase
MINDLIKKLPEVYQNIYGHPEYKTSRDCKHRESYITDVVKAYKRKTGRLPKVLDIGCAQGFYSLTLAEMGCDVTGVDFNPQNIVVCNALAQEAELKVKFVCDEIGTAFVYEKYDIVLALSVYHHIALKSYSHAKHTFNLMASVADIVISEMAVKEEGFYWSENLPLDYADWFSEQRFYKEIAFTDTHLTSVRRPFIISSNKYFCCKGDLYEIESSTTKSYADGLDLPYKRIYFADGYLCKIVHKSTINPAHSFYMYCEGVNEVDALEINLSFLPALIAYEITDDYAQVVLQIEKGELLYDKIKRRDKIKTEWLFDILANLIEIEERGLYHNDIRPWNVVIASQQKLDGTADHAFLIDAGAITVENKDCGGGNTYMAFYRLLDSFLSQFTATSFITAYSSMKVKSFKNIADILKELLK